MVKLTRDELAFLRWLRVNGGQGSLADFSEADLTNRMLSMGYITSGPDTARPKAVHFTLTAQGYEALGLHGHG